jgi:hypothetical protein
MQTIESVKLYSTPEAAELLGCSDGLIRKIGSIIYLICEK